MRIPVKTYGALSVVVLALGVGVYRSSCAESREAEQGSAQGEDRGKSHKEEERPVEGRGRGVVASATLKSGHFSMAQVSGPAFDISIVIKNHTARQLELGEILVVLEKEQGSDNFASSYLARERSAAGKEKEDQLETGFLSAVRREPVGIQRRYQLDWGEDIDKDGSSIVVFRAGGRISVSMSNPGAYQGLGWGRVSRHAQRTIPVEVPFPYKIKGAREYLAVVLPWVGDGPKQVTILRFEPTEQADSTFKLVETTTVAMQAADLRALATNAGVDAWRRVFALNWLVETAPNEATGLLVELVRKETPQALRMAAGYNLASLKAKEGVEPLKEALASAQDDRLRYWALEALGEIGDNAAAPAVRALFDYEEDLVAQSAIKAAGNMKDAESVTMLLAIVADNKKDTRHDAAATALATIGNPAAIQGLVGILNDTNNERRELAAEKLGLSGNAEAVPALAAVAADGKTEENLRRKALGALGKLGGGQAIAAIRTGAESDQEQVRLAALDALSMMTDPPAVTALIEYAQRAGYPSQDRAVSELAQGKKTQALPVLRRLVTDRQTPSKVRQEACQALGQMEDKEGVAALQTALDDSDKDVYEQALSALFSIGSKEADQAATAALKSTHARVRRSAAGRIAETKPADAAPALWEAYRAETDELAGSALAGALVAVRFADSSVVPFLVGRLNPKTNGLWYEDVRLLRQITAQDIGPEYEHGRDEERDVELAKWRAWAEDRQ